MKNKKNGIITLLLIFTLFIVSSCGSSTTNNENITPDTNYISETNDNSSEIADATDSISENEEEQTGIIIDKDREGNQITLPKTIDSIISMGPSNTEILITLGFADKIIASDTYSENIIGLEEGIPLFSMMTPDGEQIIELQPDVIFVTGMSKAGGDDPFKVVSDTGICIIYIPSSSSIEGIKEDIRYMAAVMGEPSKAETIIEDMEREIDEIKKIGDTITDKKTVYFEISAPPYMMGFGKNTFLNEILELVGVQNILSDHEGWVSISDEVIVESNPDVILTSVNYIDNPVDEIMARPGWNILTAVENEDVYYIDTDSSNRPSPNIIKAMHEIAKAVYPDKY